MKLKENNIFIVSKQFLQSHIEENTINIIKNLNLDIIAFDETHFTGSTILSKKIIKSYSSENTVKILLTATYFKPLKEFNIPLECQMFWNIEDEQICKSILQNENNIEKLKQIHGIQNVDSTIQTFNVSINEIFKPYEFMPNLNLITNMFEYEKYKIIKENIMNSCYGFSFDVLFSLKNKKFMYENEIRKILRYITGSEKEQDYKNGDKSIFRRIKNMSQRDCFTQIWFLPSDNINYISENLKELMQQDRILKNYNIMCINRKNENLAKNVKDDITNEEINTKKQNKFGLILLAGNMLNLGITINSCDVVILLNNTLSSDKLTQQIFRCMTEGENKKCGFVVDLNISRVLNTCMTYNVKNSNLTSHEKLKYIVENNLINIDVDMFENKNDYVDEIMKKLMNIWKEDPINNFKCLLKNLDDDIDEFDNTTQKLLNDSFTKNSGANVNAKIIFKNENDIQNIQSGKNIKHETNECKSDEINEINEIDEKDNNNEKEIHISFTKDVLPYIIPLICILTIKDKNTNFVQMIQYIKNNKELLEIFDEQCKIWWNNKDVINIINVIIENYFNQNTNTFNVFIQIKLSLLNMIDEPNALLELINECLKPKDIEKKQFGEVFTPLQFINDFMLKDLEFYYNKKYNANIWNNKNLTFYDPASGMGNYPIAIYYKLLDGLKDVIVNLKERKKHIIEKQLFMGELNKKNCFMIKQIFDFNDEYKLNLYEGDTLNINIKNVFNVDSFDVIIGNPPYNENFTKAGASPLYHKFIEYYINKCTYLNFIVPSRWFSGGKGLEKFRNMMINRKDILFIKHFDDAKNIFGNYVDIKGGVNYFLSDKNYNGLCSFNDVLVNFSDYDIVLDSKYYDIVNKLKHNDNLSLLYCSSNYFKINTNDIRLENEQKENYLKCFVSQQKGFVKFIDKKNIDKKYDFFKVITARAAHKANSGFGNIFIGDLNEIYTQSYIAFKVNNLEEANSLKSYLLCKLPNFMLSLRKMAQDISEQTLKWIPIVPLNQIWTDDKVYKHFNLSQLNITLIQNTKIIGFKDI